MSIKVMSRVWDKSKQKGTNLVALLAIADHADDYGVAWPGLALIAKKARVKKRQAINLVERLEASGELIVIHQRGREISNRYLVTVGLAEDEIKNTLDTHPELQIDDWRDSQDKGVTNCTLSTRKGERNCTISHRNSAIDYTNNNEEKVQSGDVKGAIAIAPEPSYNHQSESTTTTPPAENFDDGSDFGFEPPDPVYAELCSYYAKHCSPSRTITKHVADKIKAELDGETPKEWLDYALEVAADNGAYNWSFIQAVLDHIRKAGSLNEHIERRKNGHKSTGKSASRANGAVGQKQKGQGGIPALETHSRYEYRADLTTGENYWYDSETSQRCDPPPGMS